MRKSANRARVGVATLLFLLCAGPVLTAIHEIASDHHFCLEHQALEEAPGAVDPDGRQSGAAAVAGRGSFVDSNRVVSEPPVARAKESRADHQGCPLAQALASRWVINQMTIGGVDQPRSFLVGSPLLASVARAPSVALLAIAPKTSPPGLV
jgi:hypothetical protein